MGLGGTIRNMEDELKLFYALKLFYKVPNTIRKL